MSDRERLLAIVVGSLVAVFVLFGGYRIVKSGFDVKNNTLRNRGSRLTKAKDLNNRSKQAQLLVAKFQEKSLDADLQNAHLNFQHWLEKQVKDVGLKDHRVNFDSIPRTKHVMKELSYLVVGVGDIEQVTELLYRIHSANTLHRVRLLDLQQHKDGIKMSARIDALSMPNTKVAKVEIGTISESKVPVSLDDYSEKIAMRNLFAPANEAPKLKSLRTQTVEVGSKFNYKVEATDPEDQGLVFELDDSAPDWMDISKSGKLSGRPKEEAEHTFKVYVADKGIPAKEDVGELTVKVVPQKIVEEKVEEDEFDAAEFAFLTGIVRGTRDTKPKVLISLRDKDEIKYLVEGDDLKVGKWRGEVMEVNSKRNVMTIQTEDGDFELRLGRPLSQARKMPKSEGGAGEAILENLKEL